MASSSRSAAGNGPVPWFSAIQGGNQASRRDPRGPLRRRSFHQRFWLPAVDASVGQPCRFHDLRHTHAALLIAANTHPKLLQARLGHTSIKTTLDIYGHLYEPLDEIVADRLEQLIANVSSVGTVARVPTLDTA